MSNWSCVPLLVCVCVLSTVAMAAGAAKVAKIERALKARAHKVGRIVV